MINPGGQLVATGTPTRVGVVIFNEMVKDSASNSTSGLITFSVVDATADSGSSTTELTLSSSIINLGKEPKALHREAAPLGGLVTMIATVTSTGTLIPTGTVKFIGNARVLGNATISSMGTAVFSYTPTDLGTITIYAVYVGDSVPTAGSTSEPIELEVILCIHGSSKISLGCDRSKGVCELKKNNVILAADGKLEVIDGIVKCWNQR